MSEIHLPSARLEARVDDVEAFVENELELPDGIEDVEVVRRNNQLRLESTPSDGDLSKYTPTSVIKGTVKERRVIVEEGKETHETMTERKKSGWTSLAQEEEEVETVAIEYVHFNGTGDDLICHSMLSYEMFEVLLALAEVAHEGYVEGIVVEDGGIRAVRRDHEGNDVPVEVSIDTEADTQAAKYAEAANAQKTGSW